MCGFLSIFDISSTLRRDEFSTAANTLRHRGPDDYGSYNDGSYQTHFFRLSINDTSFAGHQPMSSTDGRFVLSFNGEIYNFIELRKELQGYGHTFTSTSDTEVLLVAYQEFGPECVQKLRGMFAFTIWDRQNKELIVARDRFGIKPLYQCRIDNRYFFASEIKAILEVAPAARQVNEKSLFKYLARGWVDDTPTTFFTNISSFPTASLSRLRGESEQVETYWTLPRHGSSRSFEMKRVQDSFLEAVEVHLRCDVPWAATLSGGMDSSSIVASTCELLGAEHKPYAFSVIPPDTVDETPWISTVLNHTSVRHSYLDISTSSMEDLIDKVLTSHDEPFQSSSCVYQYLLRRSIALKGFKVLLVGEGGDEVFGGYRRLFWPYLFELKKKKRSEDLEEAISGAHSFMGLDRAKIVEGLDSYSKLISSGLSGQENLSAYDVLTPEWCHTHQDLQLYPSYPTGTGADDNLFLLHLQQHLFRWDIPYVLRMEDRNSMAHGIESRVPFLDHRLVEEIFCYDTAEFMRAGVNKAMLRKIMAPFLPKEITERRSKSPRPGNNSRLVYNELASSLMQQLSSPHRILKHCVIDGTLDVYCKDRENNNELRAEFWFRYYVASRWLELYG